MPEITNNLRKLVYSLSEAKHRRAENAFKAEGTKCVLDTIGYFPLRYLMATPSWLDEHQTEVGHVAPDSIYCAKPKDMERMTALSTAPAVIAVYSIPSPCTKLAGSADKNLVLALDTIQDPGNLGTIMRVADWMGVETIVCSRETVDVYSPKVVQATMGAISRINLIYGNLPELIAEINAPAVYGTFLNGENINTAQLENRGIIVIGNEGRGISDAVATLVNRRITIPSYPAGRVTSESLNAAVATAITLAAFRRI